MPAKVYYRDERLWNATPTHTDKELDDLYVQYQEDWYKLVFSEANQKYIGTKMTAQRVIARLERL